MEVPGAWHGAEPCFLQLLTQKAGVSPAPCQGCGCQGGLSNDVVKSNTSEQVKNERRQLLPLRNVALTSCPQQGGDPMGA